jgi:hypothetical protein
MNRKIFPILLAFVLALALWGGLPPQKAQAAITSVSLNYYPTYIPQDAPASCASGTPFVVIATVNATDTGSDQYFTAHTRLPVEGSACTFNPSTGTWQNETTGTTSLRHFTLPAGQTTFQLVFYVRARSDLAFTTLRVAAYPCMDDTFTTCPAAGNIASSPAGVTPMDMTTSGGWLEESGGVDVAARAGRYIAVKNGSTLVGLYSAEDNAIPEGYVYAAGGYRVAAPSCVGCGYTVETWLPGNPGTPEGGVNTLGLNGCPADITAGGTASLDSCNSPTAIRLESFAAASSGEATTLALVASGLSLLLVGLYLSHKMRSKGLRG